jgi:hypothetical protein
MIKDGKPTKSPLLCDARAVLGNKFKAPKDKASNTPRPEVRSSTDGKTSEIVALLLATTNSTPGSVGVP